MRTRLAKFLRALANRIDVKCFDDPERERFHQWLLERLS